MSLRLFKTIASKVAYRAESMGAITILCKRLMLGEFLFGCYM